LLGLKKKPKPTSTYHKHECECGSKLFRNVSLLGIQTWDDGSRNMWISESDLRFECIKCGIIYNRYGEKEGE
jgi:hypothetical protein